VGAQNFCKMSRATQPADEARVATSGLTEEFTPVRVLELELSGPIPALDVPDEVGAASRALVLVRLHTQPLGFVELELPHEGLSAAAVAADVWLVLSDAARAHLERDGLPVPEILTAEGVPSPSTPPCAETREGLLRDAPSASVIVATHERPEQLARCLDSLLELEYPTYEITVVDSAPTSQATSELIVGRYSDVVRYLSVAQPGLAVAHNAALPSATGEILAFIDDDVVADRLWLASLASAFAIDGDIAGATGLILPLEVETLPQSWVVGHTRLNKGFERQIFDLDEHRPRQPLYPYAAGIFGSGTNMAFSAAFLREIGGFDTTLGVGTVTRGGDDLAAFFDVVESGHKLVYEPGAIVWHDYRRDYASLARHFFSYGVGLTAFLTRAIFERPRRLLTLTRLLPLGIAHMLRIRSPNTIGGVPRRFVYREWVGMLLGPVAYLVSRRRERAQSRRRRQLPRRPQSSSPVRD
jgi:GT2 family glycosyltransferase